jgi:hypothetical protein
MSTGGGGGLILIGIKCVENVKYYTRNIVICAGSMMGWKCTYYDIWGDKMHTH